MLVGARWRMDRALNSMVANARFTVTSWNEEPYSEGDGLPKMTRASVRKTYTGDIEGNGLVEYLMMYRGDATAVFVGLERITGRLAGRTGSFVLQRIGVAEVRARLEVQGVQGVQGVHGVYERRT